jgi:signal transduction histidine kinase
MRERLTAAFVAITLVLLLAGGLVRSFAVSGELRQRESDFVADQARVVGQGVAAATAAGEPVDEAFLRRYLTADVRLGYTAPDGSDTVLTGSDFVGDDETVSGTVATDDGEVTVTRSRAAPVDTLIGGDPATTFGLLAVMLVVSGVAGYAVARGLSAPFRRLAAAAEALGRGRFDLDLPRSRVPEARAIAQALDSSATQLRDRLERERAFGLLASHVLRTPLTSLQLTLEELVEDPETSGTTRATAVECLAAVSRIGDVAAELVEVSGRGVLLAGAAVPLRDVATAIAQRWSERLDERGRSLTAAVDGDLDVLVTPGPVEQALDLVLEHVVRRRSGGVRLVFDGQPATVRVDVICADAGAEVPPDELPPATQAVLTALGGRIEAPGDGSVLRVLMPRR